MAPSSLLHLVYQPNLKGALTVKRHGPLISGQVTWCGGEGSGEM